MFGLLPKPNLLDSPQNHIDAPGPQTTQELLCQGLSKELPLLNLNVICQVWGCCISSGAVVVVVVDTKDTIHTKDVASHLAGTTLCTYSL